MKQSILIIDDDASQRELLRATLEEQYRVLEAKDGRQAVGFLSDDPLLRLIVTDLTMPELNGFELIKSIRKQNLGYIYIIVLTASGDQVSRIKALSLGADDYLEKPVLAEELDLRIKGGIRKLKLESQEQLIFAMAKLSEYRSPETGFHLERVYHYTRLLGRELSISNPELGLSSLMTEEYARLSALHDLGKIAIPDKILQKPGSLTPEEMKTMRTHSEIGGNIIKDIYRQSGAAYLKTAYEIALHHHEKWDGTGYPRGLKGGNIPFAARVVAVADTYDALTSIRSYKKPFHHNEAKEFLKMESGKHFDPVMVTTFVNHGEECLSIKGEFKDR